MFVVLFFLLLNGFSMSASRREAQKVIGCYNEMNKENDILHLLLEVKNSDQINAFCGKMSVWMKCISDNEDQLSTAQNTAYLQLTSGIHQFWLNVCLPGTGLTIAYRAHAPCYELVRDQMLSCGSEVPPANSPAMRETKIRCCILQEFRQCMAAAVTVRCGEEAGNVTTEIMRRFHKTFMKECEDTSKFQCPTDVTPLLSHGGYLTSSSKQYYSTRHWLEKQEERKKWEEIEKKCKHKNDAGNKEPLTLLMYLAVMILVKFSQ